MAKLFRTPIDLGGLEVRNFRVHVLASDPGSPVEGQMWFNSTGNVLKYYDGSTVFTVATGTVAVDVVSNVASGTILGRVTGGSGDSEELTPTQVRTLINVEDGADVTDATNVDAAGATMNTDTSLAGNSYFLDEDNMASDSAAKVPSQQSVKAYVDAQVAAALSSEMTFQGDYNASTNSPDLDTTPSGVMKGDTYVVTVAGSFFGSVDLEVGDTIIARIDGADAAAEWVVVQANVTPAMIRSAIKYAEDVGDGVETDWVVNHSLDTRDVVVTVFDAVSYEEVEVDVEHTDADNVTLVFAVAPTTDEFRVVVVG